MLNLKRLHVSVEWRNCDVKASGKNKKVQQASLRKKLKEHFSSNAHKIGVSQLLHREDDAITKCIDAMHHTEVASTCKIFNTIYSLAKRSRPFSDIEAVIELQKKKGLEMGVGLRSRHTAVKIVEHIANTIRSDVFNKIIEKNKKVCIIVDEASSISNKPVLIIYLKIEDCDCPPTVFLDLVELNGLGAEAIYTTLLNSLHNAGFSDKYLKKNLIVFCSDGASVMIGRSSGVGTRLKNFFPNIIIWHCLNHRLQLALYDSVNDIKHVNHFKNVQGQNLHHLSTVK